MNFLRKLFGSKKKESASNKNDQERITIYDKFGREMQITKGEWRDKVLKANLKQVWDNPDELYNMLLSAFNDGFFADVENAAKQLSKIDSSPSRGTTMLAILYLQTDRPEKAETILLEHIDKHGEEGIILTNLAKAQSTLGREDESLKTLWRGLELDPNQDNALLWYQSIHREKEGDSGALTAFKRVASLPGSWRAQLWIARSLLEESNIDEALALYRESTSNASEQVPADLLQQISGDLGNQGHLPQIIELVAPHYDPIQHGLQVGNNLIKAYLDLGHFAQARDILQKLHSQQRPDWKEALGYWETELAKLRNAANNLPEGEQLEISALAIDGPLWLKENHPYGVFFPAKNQEAPTVVFIGNSAETAQPTTEVTIQLSDNPGRMSRALPLYLSEQISLNYKAKTRVLVYWVQNRGGGFVLSGKKSTDANIAQHARLGNESIEEAAKPDFAVYTHLVTRGENWTLQLRTIRTIDASCVANFEYDFPESGFFNIEKQVIRDLKNSLVEELALVEQIAAIPNDFEGPELDHYLLRLEQCLAVRCNLQKEDGAEFLSNPAEIIDGALQFCIQNPSHIPGRLLLTRIIDGVNQKNPALVSSFANKLSSLQSDYPIDHSINDLISKEIEDLIAAKN